MGFYGNVTNISKTTFVFDKTYSSRYEMERNMGSDGVYAGRYVLVEYDSGNSADTFKAFYFNPADQWFYASNNYEPSTKVRIVSSMPPSGSTELYVLVGEMVRDRGQSDIYTRSFYITGTDSFTKIGEATTNYMTNYLIDRQAYGEGRGWDSTVWTKVYQDGFEKYVQIAELNTVIPTFDLTVDAPTQTPVNPHFDQNSTNVYYKLHMQPQWGFRVKEGTSGKSDVTVAHETANYNPATGILDITTKNVPGNIYFNSAGFNVSKSTHNTTEMDTINVLPSGSSGTLYNKHDGTGVQKTSNDIYEVSVMLPSIGNAIASVWDSMYSVQRNLDVDWNSTKGLRLVIKNADGTFTYNKDNLKTFAGCINSVHDMLGMIIVESLDNSYLNDNGLKYIFYSNKKYYRVCKYDTYVLVAQANYQLGAENLYYESNGATWNSNRPYEANKIYTKGAPAYRFIELVEFADKLNTLHGILLKASQMLEFDNPESRNRETVQGSINVLNDLIEKIKTLVPGKFLITNKEGNIQTANHTNDNWVKTSIDMNNPAIKFEHLFTSQPDTTSSSNVNTAADKNNIKLYTPIVDAKGHVVGKNIETVTLPYGFKYVAAANSTAVTDVANQTLTQIDADNTQDTLNLAVLNKWIKFNTTPANNRISFGHITSPVAIGTYGLEQNETVDSLDVDNTFEVPCFTVDEAGHITKAETHTVTIPELFTKVSVTGTSVEEIDSTGANGIINADTIKDILSLNAANKWIQLKVSGDNVEFRHLVKIFNETTASTDLDNSQTFSVQELTWDKAGHLTGSVKRTYTLPDSFKTLSIGAASSSTTPGTSTGGNIIATTQNDLALINPQNKWITLSTTGKTLSIGHSAPSTASITKGQDQNKTLTFGDTFKTTQVGIDQTGHTSILNEFTITIPQPSLTNGIGNVVTGLNLNQSTGALTETKSNVGILPLTGYSIGANSGAVVATDSINTAFGKIQTNLNTLNGGAATPGSVAYQIAQVVAGAPSDFDTLKEIAEWIQSDKVGTAALVIKVDKNTTDIATMSPKVEKSITDITAIDTRVTKNTTDIGAANTKITKNTGDITALDTRVTKNASDIAALESGLTANASKSVDVTLTTAGWTGSGPYTQTISVSGLGAVQNGNIALAHSANASQRTSARKAMLAISNQSAGTLTIVADGTKPTVNIPCTVILLG